MRVEAVAVVIPGTTSIDSGGRTKQEFNVQITGNSKKAINELRSRIEEDLGVSGINPSRKSFTVPNLPWQENQNASAN